jgi:hypothetical protein
MADHGQSRVDSLRDTAPRVASRPEVPGRPAARQIFGRASTLTRDNSAPTCEDAGSWTHACLSAITRFCSSTAHFRVQATGQLRNPGRGACRTRRSSSKRPATAPRSRRRS